MSVFYCVQLSPLISGFHTILGAAFLTSLANFAFVSACQIVTAVQLPRLLEPLALLLVLSLTHFNHPPALLALLYHFTVHLDTILCSHVSSHALRFFEIGCSLPGTILLRTRMRFSCP